MQQRKSLGPWALALINISAILSLRHLPAQAVFGLDSLYFYFVAAVLFLIPISLICAELATTWPNRHGLYGWIYEAFGSRLALVVVWWSWMAAISTIVTNLVFFTVLFAEAVFPGHSNNPSFVMFTSLALLWFITFINLFGMKFSSYISSVGAILGTIIPILLLAALALLINIKSPSLTFATGSLSEPGFDLRDLSLLTQVILGYSGVELAAFHAADAKDPQRDYLKALLIAALSISSLYILGTLAIILVLSPSEITLTLGVVQAFGAFLKILHLDSLAPFLHLAMIIGTFAAINSWLISPAKGIFAATEHFSFPNWMTRSNKNHVPVNILVLQGAIASALLVVLKVSPSVETSYWILSMLTTQYAIILYIPIIAAFKLLKKIKPDQYRPFKLGGIMSYLCATSTMIVSILVLIMTFVPPARVEVTNIVLYELFFISIFAFFSIPPMLLKKLNCDSTQ